jgi:hypothetical protein
MPYNLHKKINEAMMKPDRTLSLSTLIEMTYYRDNDNEKNGKDNNLNALDKSSSTTASRKTTYESPVNLSKTDRGTKVKLMKAI